MIDKAFHFSFLVFVLEFCGVLMVVHDTLTLPIANAGPTQLFLHIPEFPAKASQNEYIHEQFPKSVSIFS